MARLAGDVVAVLPRGDDGAEEYGDDEGDGEADDGRRSLAQPAQRQSSSRNSWKRDSRAASALRDRNEMWLHLQLPQLQRCLMASLSAVRMGLKGVATRAARSSAEMLLQYEAMVRSSAAVGDVRSSRRATTARLRSASAVAESAAWCCCGCCCCVVGAMMCDGGRETCGWVGGSVARSKQANKQGG